nr:zinc finger, CCHC-type [Tanacetum cinerariifolium]
MTTSSANNSVFRGFFEKQKLNGPNFIDWYRQLRIVLSIEDKLNYLEQPIPSAPEEGQSVSSYVLKMKGYIDNLERLGHPVTLGLGEIGRGLSSVLSRVTEEEKERSFGSWWFRASRKLKPGALSLYVGNGQREAVEAIGVFYLCIPSELEIVLNNCLYAPSITRGVIYVSRLYEDGFINRFVKNKREKDKIGTKPDKNEKLGEARKSQKQLQSREQEKLKKMQVEGPKMQIPTKLLKKKRKNKD